MLQSLPGIRRIYYTPCLRLPDHLMIAAICGASATLYRAALTQISFSGTPSFTREGSILNNARAEKSTLEFRTTDYIPDGVRLAFIAECVNGYTWLIGTNEPNYPVIEFSDSSGSPGGDPAVRTYKITHTDIRSGIPAVL